MRRTPMERLLSRSLVSSSQQFAGTPCVETTLAKREGYGLLGVGGGRTVQAHRFAYETLVGPIPEGLKIDHLCCNRACVNVAHLEPVTNRVNVLRGFGSTATVCRRGHARPDRPSKPCPDCQRLYKRMRRLEKLIFADEAGASC